MNYNTYRPLTEQLTERIELLLREQINTEPDIEQYVSQTTEKLMELLATEIKYYRGK